jgi:hypothetical protein
MVVVPVSPVRSAIVAAEEKQPTDLLGLPFLAFLLRFN